MKRQTLIMKVATKVSDPEGDRGFLEALERAIYDILEIADHDTIVESKIIEVEVK